MAASVRPRPCSRSSRSSSETTTPAPSRRLVMSGNMIALPVPHRHDTRAKLSIACMILFYLRPTSATDENARPRIGRASKLLVGEKRPVYACTAQGPNEGAGAGGQTTPSAGFMSYIESQLDRQRPSLQLIPFRQSDRPPGVAVPADILKPGPCL